jgi:uncharacterized protein (DUF342 family)
MYEKVIELNEEHVEQAQLHLEALKKTEQKNENAENIEVKAESLETENKEDIE